MSETGFCGCGKETDYFGPDPFDSEINGDDSPVWLCESCYYDSCMEI